MAVISSETRKAVLFSEQQGFISNLEKHHASLGTLYRNIPVLPININLFSLYHCVRIRGGFNEVTRKREWNSIAKQLFYPHHTVTRVAQLLWYQYYQLLYSFEISHSRITPEVSHSSHPSLPTIVIPALYEPPIDIREVSLTRVRCSLLSGFPNEVELAINTLVILSSRKQFYLKNELTLLDLLLAHVGIFKGDDLSNLFNCTGYAGRHNLSLMWHQLLTPATYTRYIELAQCTDSISEDYRDVLAPPEIVEKADYLYRLYAVATILYNLSFLEENSSFILEHNQSVRFLLACLSCNNVILQHFAWDSLSIVGEKVPLCSSELSSPALLQLVIESLESDDSFVLLRNLELLRCLAAADSDIEIPREVTYHILRLLTLYDVQLLLRCVETLYQLTETSITNCNYISTSSHGIDILITCLTRDIDFLACHSADRFTMVKEIHREEELNRGIPNNIHFSISSLCEETNRHTTPGDTKRVGSTEKLGFGPDELAKKWLRSCFECSASGTISKTQLYSGYHTYLKNIFQMQSSLGFMRLLEHIRQIFPKTTLKKSIAPDGKSSFVFYYLRIKQHISSEEISNPSIITANANPFTTPSKRKMHPISKISPVPPLMNHAIPNNRILNTKLRTLAESSKSTQSHNFVIKNIFNNTKAIPPKAPFSPPLKSPPPHNPVQSKHPPFPIQDTHTEIHNPDPTIDHSDPMLLQIPIKLLQKRPNNSPVSPKQINRSDSTEDFFPEQNGHTENTHETSILKKRPQPSSPNCVISKKPTPNSPSETHKQFADSQAPILENGDTHLVNGEVDKFNWDESADLITSQKEESPIEYSQDNSNTAVDENISKRVSHIENSEFPLVSISLKTKVETYNTDQNTEYAPKEISPTVDILANTHTSTASLTDESDTLAGKKLKKSSKEKQQLHSTPTCQWHNCLKSFDEWDELLRHACSQHAQVEYPSICLWQGCKTHRNTRSRPSLMRHFQVCHCTPNPIQSKVVSVAHLLDKLKRTPPLEKHFEGVLSRSLHLTTTLILRNILLKCPESISNLAIHEYTLLTVATTETQAGRYVTEILSEISSFKHSKL